MNYLYLIIAIIFEVTGTTLMKVSNGFSLLLPSIGIFVAYALSFMFLSFTLKTLEVGVAYAIWSALGLILIALIGIVFFNESVNILKISSIIIIVLGLITLNLSGIKH